MWPEPELQSRPLFARLRGMNGRDHDLAESTLMTRNGPQGILINHPTAPLKGTVKAEETGPI
jgi:hypothetical protein